MKGQRSDHDIDAALEVWMDVVAPAAVPGHVLEEAFGRTVAAGQVRTYPWDWVARRGHRPSRPVYLGLVVGAGLLIASLGFGLLGGGGGIGPGPTPTTSATPSPIPTPSAASPSAPTPMPVTPEASVAVVGASGLATDGQVVWVLTATGQVIRIDPATNTAGAGTQLGATTDLYNGIAADRTGVWATDWDATMLYRVDPTTGKVVAKIPAGVGPKGVLATGTAVWVADTRGGAVLRIDPATNKIVATIPVGPTGPSGPNWLGSGLGSIWVGIPNASTVVRIDPVTNAIQATIPVPAAVTPCGAFAITDAAVWTPSCESTMTARIDPTTNKVVATVDLGGNAYTPAIIGGAPWGSIDTGSSSVPASIARVAAVTNTVDRRLSPGADFGGGGDIVVAAGSVWVIDGGHDRVLRLPLSAFPPG